MTEESKNRSRIILDRLIVYFYAYWKIEIV